MGSNSIRKFVARKKFQMQKLPSSFSEKFRKVNMSGNTLEFVEKFCYLRDVLSEDGRVYDLAVSRTRAEWNQFKELFGILCRKAPKRMKHMVYKICVRSTMCYEADSCITRVEDISRFKTTEMRML